MPELRKSRSLGLPRCESELSDSPPYVSNSICLTIYLRISTDVDIKQSYLSSIGIDERAYMDSGTVCISHPQGAFDSPIQKSQKATVVMANDAVSRSLAFSTSIGKTRSGIVILLGLMLTVVPGSVVAQSSQQQQQQEQQQR